MRLTPLVLLPLALLGGCVVHYGEGPRAGGEGAEATEGSATVEGEVAPPTPNLSERYAPLESAFDSLMASDPGEDADRRDRLDAARDLSRDLRRGKKDPHELIEAYLRRIAEIESRAVPAEAPLLVIGPAVNEEVVEEAPLGQPDGEVIGEEPIGEPAEVEGDGASPTPDKDPKADRGGQRVGGKPADPSAPPPTIESAGSSARDALAKNDYKAALDVLRPLKDDPRFAEIAPLWQEAVDGWVHHERERAGLLFQTSRAWPQAERDAATQEVKGILEGLLRDYPETTYKAAIVRNLQLVERETAAAPK
ncbi:hypothetical protein L6R49_16620 [Myxococcota bacterium]|nr:hypothetical protein [Myxococcota bacterium]